MEKKAIHAVLLALMLAFTQSPSWAGCLEYDPVEVELRGKLVRVVFPGLPNFEDVLKGDKPEVAWVLRLPIPICVNAKPNDLIDEAAKDIIKIQLVLFDNSLGKYKALIGKKVVVKGGLFHGHTGHHHTEVLLKVKHMKRFD